MTTKPKSVIYPTVKGFYWAKWKGAGWIVVELWRCDEWYIDRLEADKWIRFKENLEFVGPLTPPKRKKGKVR